MNKSDTPPDQKVWSRDLGVEAWARALFECDFEPTEKDRKLRELARRYHAETETYDRTVCTGPIRHGSALPIGPHEMGLVSRNAREVLRRVMQEAAAVGITGEELRAEISRCA